MKVDLRNPIKFLLDEDLSPKNAQTLCEEDNIDAVAVRDRGRLGQSDRAVLDLAFDEDRILITANVRDFEKLASAREVHNGIVFICQGSLTRGEQLSAIRRAIAAIYSEAAEGRDLVNRVLYIEESAERLEPLPT